MKLVVSDTSPLRALAQLDLLYLPGRLAPRFRPRRSLSRCPRCALAWETGRRRRSRWPCSYARPRFSSTKRPDEKVAIRFGLDPLGTLGLLVRAKRAGLVGSIAPLMARLEREIGFRISESVRQAALRLADE